MLKHEGGFVDHPKIQRHDQPGVTRAVYEQWMGRHVSETKCAPDADDVARSTKITTGQSPRRFTIRVDWAAFDWAVNSGSDAQQKRFNAASTPRRTGATAQDVSEGRRVRRGYTVKYVTTTRQRFYGG